MFQRRIPRQRTYNQWYASLAPDTVTFLKTLIFGSGDASGLGMDITVEDAHANSTGITAAAVVDLINGKVDKVFGGSYQAGVTRRTIVNVPVASTISIASALFAGAYGSKNEFPWRAAMLSNLQPQITRFTL